MKNKRYSEFFTYIHFGIKDTKSSIKEFISEELKYNSEAQVTNASAIIFEDESGNSELLYYKLDSDNIDWYYSDEKGNKVNKEDSLTEDGMYRVYFSRIIISDYKGDDYYLEDWTTQNDYFLKNNVCEHNNTITNECSDCNEQELFDVFLKHTLRGIRNILWNTNNNVSDVIDDLFVGDADYNDELAEKLEQEILRRLTNG